MKLEDINPKDIIYIIDATKGKPQKQKYGVCIHYAALNLEKKFYNKANHVLMMVEAPAVEEYMIKNGKTIIKEDVVEEKPEVVVDTVEEPTVEVVEESVVEEEKAKPSARRGRATKK